MIIFFVITLLFPEIIIEAEEIDGKALYRKYCATCHGSLENSSKKGASASGIESAINKNKKMKFLKHLSYEKIRAIAIALKSK